MYVSFSWISMQTHIILPNEELISDYLNPKVLRKTGGEHSETHERRDYKSGLFHLMLILIFLFFSQLYVKSTLFYIFNVKVM